MNRAEGLAPETDADRDEADATLVPFWLQYRWLAVAAAALPLLCLVVPSVLWRGLARAGYTGLPVAAAALAAWTIPWREPWMPKARLAAVRLAVFGLMLFASDLVSESILKARGARIRAEAALAKEPLDAYRAAKGRYPADAAELEAAGIRLPAHVRYAGRIDGRSWILYVDEPSWSHWGGETWEFSERDPSWRLSGRRW